MRYKRKLVVLIIVIILLTALEYTLPGNPDAITFYTRYIFRPYQSFRNLAFGYIPFSVGDVLYCIALFAILSLLVRWIYYLIKIRTHHGHLLISFIHTLIFLLTLYILFIVGWGANYYKPSLGDYWKINSDTTDKKRQLVNFDIFLVDKLNTYAPHYHPHSLNVVDSYAQHYYERYTDVNSKLNGLKAKSSVFNYWMERFGIQGYYDPFTGEAQVNRYLPAYMLPFVVCHEMAHQTGVAAEGDANLMAYVIGTSANDSSFNYSSYLNIWLYVQSRVRYSDSATAKSLQEQLNPLTLAHIDTLRAIRRKYGGVISQYSGRVYDEYLRLHDQKGGIKSYGNVALTAWAWEQQRSRRADTIIKIP